MRPNKSLQEAYVTAGMDLIRALSGSRAPLVGDVDLLKPVLHAPDDSVGLSLTSSSVYNPPSF